jgi:hypothetical protein
MGGQYQDTAVCKKVLYCSEKELLFALYGNYEVGKKRRLTVSLSYFLPLTLLLVLKILLYFVLKFNLSHNFLLSFESTVYIEKKGITACKVTAEMSAATCLHLG